MDETPQERQNDETEALRAIYAEQFTNCNEGISDWKPLNVIITILPLKENGYTPATKLQVDLHVIATEEYPNEVPKVMLENAVGMSKKLLKDIQSSLAQLTKSLLGEVMVFELVQHVQIILTEYNKPGYQSFYDEMMSRQKEKLQNEIELKKAEADLERQLIRLEVKELKNKRKHKKKSKKESGLNIINEEPQILQKVAEKINDNENVIFKNEKHTKATEETNNKDISLNGDVSWSWASHNTRISKEFEILDFIGKGAFGDVLKVRNKLDGCLYATKRIQLNSKSIQLNKKIMREVKLLSRLNHENVVRYFNSWIECIVEENEEVQEKPLEKPEVKKKSIEVKPFLESLSLSFPRPGAEPSFSDEEEDDDDNDWISFVRDTDETESSNGKSEISLKQEEIKEPDKKVTELPNHYIYIQMEYCEKSTLRTAIDNNLYEDEKRVWRLLREIVEGLAYIHQQGIIHRDLKPVNIFIDCEDHVKIGDFGLATPHKHTVVSKGNGPLKNESSSVLEDTRHTGLVGTALYVAPELNTHCSSVTYNQKVDTYSLGVIFFEMCYRPLNTEMERLKVLSDIRHYSRTLPDDFLKPDMSRQIKLIRDLLNHKAKERPSAQEILERKYIPAIELKNVKLDEKIKHTISNPQSKAYKHLMTACFNQKTSVAEDIIFDGDWSHSKLIWYHWLIEELLGTLREIFHLHGGMYLSTPLLSPKNEVLSNSDDGIVWLMTRQGTLVNLPHHLMRSFARHLARNPTITHLKRYTFDKVFKERRMFGIHPKETFECSFDIVTSSTGNMGIECELLSLVYELINKYGAFKNKNLMIRLNHVSLINGILSYCNVNDHNYDLLRHLFNNNNNNKSKGTRENVELLNNNHDITEVTIANLTSLMDIELAPNKVMAHFRGIVKNASSPASAYCKLALRQLDSLIKNLQSLSINCPVVIAPNIVNDVKYYSGVMYEVVWDNKQKDRLDKDIIAAGGRYDNLISMYRKCLNITKETSQSAAGITIYLDRLVTTLQSNLQLFSTIDVLICSVGHNDMTKEKLKIVRDLWNAGIRSTILDSDQNLDDTQRYCEDNHIPYIVFVKESESDMARLRSWTKDRFSEKKLPVDELVDYLQKLMKVAKPGINVCNVNGNNITVPPRAQSNVRTNSGGDTNLVNISFFTEEKLTSGTRKRYENQIMNVISKSLHKLSAKTKIELIALNVDDEFIKLLAASIDINSTDSNDLAPLFKKFPRYKRDINRINDFLEELQSRDVAPIIIFYTLSQNTFKIVI